MSKDGSEMNADQKLKTMSTERAFLKDLLESSLAGDGGRVKELVAKYSSENDVPRWDVLAQFRDGSKKTALHFACQSDPKIVSIGGKEDDDDAEDIVPSLLKPGYLTPAAASVLCRSKDGDGLTPLMVAARHPDRDLSGVRVNALLAAEGGHKLALGRSKVGATALHYAAASDAGPDTIRRLYQSGKVAIRTNSTSGGTPLHWAAGAPSSGGRSDTLEALLDCGADVNAASDDANGLSALTLACAAENDAKGKLLVRRGADRTGVLPGGATVYHMAADLNLVGTLAALIEADEVRTGEGAEDGQSLGTPSATVTQRMCATKNDAGLTPLEIAVREGHELCVRLLLPSGENGEEEARAFMMRRKAELDQARGGTTAEGKGVGTSSEAESGAKLSDKEGENKETEEGDEKKDPATVAAEKRASEIMAAADGLTEEDKKRAQEKKAEGNTHFSKGEYSAAAESYAAAVLADPSDAILYSNRSASLAHMRMYDDALDDARMARALRPGWSKAPFREATALLGLGMHEKAALAAWDALRLDNENDDIKGLLQKCVKEGQKSNKKATSPED